MPLILGTNSIKDTGYNIANSCRFNDGDSAHMLRTFGTPSDNLKWTWSGWFKRCTVPGGGMVLAYCFTSDPDGREAGPDLRSDGTLRNRNWHGDAQKGNIHTNRVFRDVSAWYNLQLVYDSANATAGNRMRMYLNGTEITSFSTDANPDENQASSFNSAIQHTIGAYRTIGNFFDGYQAEIVFIDGQALTPSSFGEFSEDSPTIWMPKDPSGLTFGDNGYWLDFENSAALGNDVSGNDNDFTVGNLAAADQATDTPTNNFATMNPLAGNGTYTEGNLIVTGGNNVVSTFGVNAGRWYCECKITLASGALYPLIGIADSANPFATSPGASGYPGSHTPSYGIFGNGSLYANGSNEGDQGFSDFADNDIIGMYLDLDSGTKTIKWHVNGTEVATDNISAPDSSYVFGHYTGGESTVVGKWNFGNPTSALSSANSDPNGYGSFEYSTRESSIDYYALCTKNLAEYGG